MINGLKLSGSALLISVLLTVECHASVDEYSCLNGDHEDFVQFKDREPVRFRFSEDCLRDRPTSNSGEKGGTLDLEAYWPGMLSRKPSREPNSSSSDDKAHQKIVLYLGYTPRPDLHLAMFIKQFKSDRFELVKTDGSYTYYKRISEKRDGSYPKDAGYAIVYNDRTDFYMVCSKGQCSIKGVVDEVRYHSFMFLKDSSDWLSIHNKISDFIRTIRLDD